jgi:hypothetical protein
MKSNHLQYQHYWHTTCEVSWTFLLPSIPMVSMNTRGSLVEDICSIMKSSISMADISKYTPVATLILNLAFEVARPCG